MKRFSGIYRLIIFSPILLLSLSISNVYSEGKESQEAKEAAAFKGGRAIYYFEQGNDYKAKGDIGEAISSWSKAIEAKPDFAEAYYNRGIVFGKQDMLDEAISDFTKAIQNVAAQQLKVLAYYNRAIAYGKIEKVDEAIADYTQAIGLDPKYAPAYKNRAVAYFFKKDYVLSWQDVRKSEELGLKVSPDFIQELKSESGKEG